MADLLCPTCGRPNANHREYCDICGNPLDGALSVEPQAGQGKDDLFSEENPSASNGEQEPLDEASRLDSLFEETEVQSAVQSQDTPFPEETGEEDSRLDDYLSNDFESPSPEQSTGPDLPAETDDISRLDDYFSPDDSEPEKKADLPFSAENDEAARLDDYFQEPIQSAGDDNVSESPLEEESSRLDEFFADDPFKSPDPFQEQTFDEPDDNQQSIEEFDPFKIPPEELNLTDELKEPPVETGTDGASLETWNLFSEDAEASSEEESPEEIPQDASEEFDFLDTADTATSSPEQVQQPPQTREDQLNDREFLESESPDESTKDHTDQAPIGETSPGDWEFLDSEISPQTPDSSESLGDSSNQEAFAGEFDYLDPPDPGAPPEPESVEPTQEKSREDVEQDWGFLDPGDPEAQTDQLDSLPDSTSSGDTGEFDWLDPGPLPDLPEEEMTSEIESKGMDEESGWLDMLQNPEQRQAPVEEHADPEKPQTDWLDKIKRLNKSSDLVDDDSSFPDWLAVSEQSPAEPEEPVQPIEQESSSEVPDWLKVEDDDSLNEFLRRKDLTNEEYKPRITETSSEESDEEEDEDSPASGLSDSQQIKFPSWADKEGEQSPAPQEAGEDQTQPVGKTPSTDPFQAEEEYFDDLFSEELPDWLTAASSEEISRSLDADLAKGELPGWVEAMQPVVESSDASGLADDEEYIENYGPLAGIPSVLPAEAEIDFDPEQNAKKPLDLLISSTHQEYVNLLKRIIGDENKGTSIQRPAPLQTQRVLRWLIAIILLFTTAGTVILGTSIDAQPPTAAQIQGSGYSALYDQVDNLYDGQPVLIAYDYQPASAGELHTAAAGVVDHLMEQGTYLSFVSTQPTGPALAEQFLDTTQTEHNYVHTQKYINLGYLPGESAGLLSFMIAPQQIIPLAFDGSNAWDSPPLLEVDTINDFKMILVITDDPNTARIWIEQVAVRLENTPLTMVVSAQVEPLIQPYFRSSPQPLAGYVAGVIDSVNYEQLLGRPNLSSKIWLPFNLGIIISVLIIFIGGLANGVLSLFSRRRTILLGEDK